MNRILLLCLFLCKFLADSGAMPFVTIDKYLPETIFTDTIRPVIQCPSGPVNIHPPSGGCTAVYNYMVTATDNLPGVIVAQAQGLSSGSMFPQGNTINLFVAIDAAGNTATCSFTVSVTPAYLSLTCKSQYLVSLDGDCNVMISPAQVLTGTYGCIYSMVLELDKVPPYGNGPWSPGTVGLADLNKSYQFRVTDSYTGNYCWGNVDVIDETPPALTCASLTIPCVVTNFTPSFLKDSLGIAAGKPTASDNCTAVTTPTYTDSVATVPCSPAANGVSKLIFRTWTATDQSNNKTTCLQTIAVKTGFPDIHFPPNLTVSTCQSTNVPVSVSRVPFIKAGNREYSLVQSTGCKFDAKYADTIDLSGTCPAGRRIFRTWKVYDLCLDTAHTNPLIGVQQIDIEDLTAPVIHCTPDVTVEVPAPGCTATVDLPDFVITDDCSGIIDFHAFWTGHAGLTKSATGQLADFMGNNPALRDTLGVLDTIPGFAPGITSIIYAATDACGNTGTCQFNLHVWDKTPPTAKCKPGITAYMGQNGSAVLGASAIDDGSEDDCNPVFLKFRPIKATSCQLADQFYDTLGLCCANVGDTLMMILRVYDVQVGAGPVAVDFAIGHYSECAAPVYVRDTLPAICTDLPQVNVHCDNFNPDLTVYGFPTTISCQGADSISISADYTLFDTLCNKGTIVRNFQTWHNNAPGGVCHQKITADFEEYYFVRFPNDTVVLNCNTAGDYGGPKFFGNSCQHMKATYTDQLFTVVPDACFRIERTWKVYSQCAYNPLAILTLVPNPNPNAISNSAANLPGPVVSAPNTTGTWAPTVVKLVPTSNAPTNFSLYWSANSNGYKYTQIIKVIDIKAPEILNCSTLPTIVKDPTDNDTLLWNRPYYLDSYRSSHDLVEGPVDSLNVVASDLCAGSNVTINYLLFLDLNEDGVQETVINSTNLPAWNTIYYNNAGNPNYSGGTARSFDDRPVAANQKYGFAIQTFIHGNTKTGRVAWNTQSAPTTFVAAQLPYGTHRIRWIVSDGCGNTQTCEKTFTIKDGKGPKLVCKPVNVVEIPPSQIVQVYSADLLKQVSDNYTALNNIKLGIRREGSGQGFPYDSNGNPNSALLYSCADTGVQNIQLWAVDQEGNTSFCTSQYYFTDYDSTCAKGLPVLRLQGSIHTEANEGVSDVRLNLTLTPNNASSGTTTSTLSDSSGFYLASQSVPTSASYLLSPGKNDQPLNGVSTYDLVLISKHILGLQPLGSPYKIIAADANKNGSVTTSDIVELRKLILGVFDTFPHNQSWRFVDQSYIFPNPNNPFTAAFPEKIEGVYLTPIDSVYNFVAIKIGDVNGSAIPNAVLAADARGEAPAVVFDVDPTPRGIGAQPIPSLPSAREQGGFIEVPTGDGVGIGEVFWVRFGAVERVLGYQFTAQLDGVEVVDIAPGEGMSRDHFGVFGDAFTTSFDGDGAFAVKFRALKAGRLREMIRVSDRITRAEAYRADGSVADVAFRFGGGQVEGRALELFQNTPNPFDGRTVVGFYLPEACEASVTVTDAGGRKLYEYGNDYPKGYHEVVFDAGKNDVSGVLFYKLETPFGTLVRKMIKQ